MDQYIGGIEHAILHLLYARFWTKVMRDMGLVAIDEPFTKLLTQGMVLNHVCGAADRRRAASTTSRPTRSTPRPTSARHGSSGGRPTARRHAASSYRGMLKMGKTERNGVDPQDLIDRYGADTARLFVMFAAPPEQTLDWNDAGVEGAYRFLRASGTSPRSTPSDRLARRRAGRRAAGAPALRREIHSVLRQVSYDYERMQYNTVVSGAMKLLNALEDVTPARRGRAGAVARGLRHPAARALPGLPAHHVDALERARLRGRRTATCSTRPGPQVDESALVQDEIELVLQINGKLRGAIRVAAEADKAHIEAAALATPEFAKFAEGRRGEEGRRRAGPPGQRRRLMRRRLLLGAALVRSPAAASSSSAAARAELQDDPARRLSGALAARRRAAQPARGEPDDARRREPERGAGRAGGARRGAREGRRRADRGQPDPRVRAAPALQLPRPQRRSART